MNAPDAYLRLTPLGSTSRFAVVFVMLKRGTTYPPI
jgi:hypothetical protein